MKIYTRITSKWDDEQQRYVIDDYDAYDYDGPVAEAKGGQPDTVTQVQKNDPWSGIVPYLTGQPAPSQDNKGGSIQDFLSQLGDSKAGSGRGDPRIPERNFLDVFPSGFFSNSASTSDDNDRRYTASTSPSYTAASKGAPLPPGVLPESARLYNQGPAQYYPGQTIADMPFEKQIALRRMSQGRDYNLLGQSAGQLSNQFDLDQGPAASSDYYSSVLNNNPTQATDNFYSSQLSSDFGNQDVVGELNKTLKGDYLGAAPFMQAYGNDIMDNVNSAFSRGGRTGSGYHSATAGRELGNAASRLYSDERNRQMGAGRDLSNIYSQGKQNQFNAAGGLNANVRDNMANKFAAAGGINNQYNTGRSNQLQALGMAPGFESLRANLLNADENRRLSAGNIMQDFNQSKIDSNIDRFNFNQNSDWDNLMRYSGLINQVQHGVPATTTSSQPLYRNKLGSLAGGALAGAQLGSVLSGLGSSAASGAAAGSVVPGIGTGIGALAGGLLGFL